MAYTEADERETPPQTVVNHEAVEAKREIGLLTFLRENWLNWLLVLVPVTLAMEFLRLPELWLFVVTAIAIIPLAGLIGEATEQLAYRVGPGVGGLLNATFGNATELIIALFALQDCACYRVLFRAGTMTLSAPRP